MARYADFADDWRRAAASGYANTNPQLTLAWSLAEKGDYARAEAEAAAVAAGYGGSGGQLYRAAQINAQLAAFVGRDQSMAIVSRNEHAEQLGRQAVAWLKRAVEVKFFAAPFNRWLLVEDREFEPLRKRADFRALLPVRNVATKSVN